MQLRLAGMMAYGSLHAHKDADIEKGGQQVATMFKNAMAAIPYLAAGSATSDSASERLQAVHKYKQLVERGVIPT